MSVDSARSSSRSAAALVSRLLLYSGYTFVRQESREIAPFLEELTAGMATRIGQPHQVTCDFRARGARIQLGTGMLEEAIEELIANAAAAMPEGGKIHLSTRMATGEDSGNRRDIVIAVSDQGIGMDQASLARAKEPFFTRREVGKGMGLSAPEVPAVIRSARPTLQTMPARRR